MTSKLYKVVNVKRDGIVIFSDIGVAIRESLEKEFRAEVVRVPEFFEGIIPYYLNNGVTAVSYNNGAFDNLVSLAGKEKTVRSTAETISRSLEGELQEL